MLSEQLTSLYHRDLLKLKQELLSYSNEEDLWQVQGEIKNSAGNLALHLVGNLRHFIGCQLGQTDYVRMRDREFLDKHVPRSTILQMIDVTDEEIHRTLSKIDDDQWQTEYPLYVFGQPMTVGYFLIHLTTHLNYHLGQINYHRRLLTN